MSEHQFQTPAVYLASASPRRRELLERMGVVFEVIEQQVDEQVHAEETPEVFVIRLALEKAREGLANRPTGAQAPVLGADTAVVIDDTILGKPADQDQAMAMLERLSGRTHRVLTGVALVGDEGESTRLSMSRVSFREITPAEREAYWRTGEPKGKACGYAIQGLGGVFAEQLEGSYSGVMGLPLFETDDLLRSFGLASPLHAPAGQ